MDYQSIADFLSNNLRLRTLPVAVRFLKGAEAPEKARRPSKVMGKKITLCQAVTLARSYGWTMAIAREDLQCVPALIAFGLAPVADQRKALGRLLAKMSYAKDDLAGACETNSLQLLPSGAYDTVVIGPLAKTVTCPDCVALYGNPAQMARLSQAWTYSCGSRVPSNVGGKVECTEYLIAPGKTQGARITIPGIGDRIFSMTQDDEMVFSLPGDKLEMLIKGLEEAGRRVGARYPITFYQNFQPDFPSSHRELAKEEGID
ncbi:MAG: DUF169 domain-containing protein [Desulfobulbaceae bacterium]|nr:DUF169 domain-containing protein [Desulfobulbaceae bacterium]